MADENYFDFKRLAEQEEPPKGSFNIALRAITRGEYGIDYWTGGLLAAALVYQVISGIFLSFYYQAGNPYNSTIFIISKVPFGLMLLTSHLYMAYFMVALLFVHMFRQYFIGAYRGAWRWAQWLLGLVLFGLVYLIATLGYMLSYTYVGILGLHVGEVLMQRSIIGRLFPALANWLITALVGNGTTALTFQHVFIMHVAILTGLVFLVFPIHFYLYERSGPYEPAGLKKKRSKEDYVPWFPTNLFYTLFLAFVLIGIVMLASALAPQQLVQEYGFVGYNTLPFPDWYMMPMYKLMDVGGLGLSTGGVPLLVALGGFMVLLPFIDKYKGDAPLERPAITAIGIFIILFFVIMAFWGYIQPGLSQTRLFTLIMFAGIAFVAFAVTYAMKFVRDDVIRNEIKNKTV